MPAKKSSARQVARYVLPDGFTAKDLDNPEYARPLANAAVPMIDHCERILADLPQPRKARKVYLRQLFASRDRIIDAICTFNAALFAVVPTPTKLQSKATHAHSNLTSRNRRYSPRQEQIILDFVERPEFDTGREYFGKTCYSVKRAAIEWANTKHPRPLPRDKEEFIRAYKTLVQRRRRRKT